jgi:hypothetical protein
VGIVIPINAPILLLAGFRSQQEIRRLARQVEEVTPAVDVLVKLQGEPRLFPAVTKNIPFPFKALEVGARTVVQLASVPGHASVSGLFFQSVAQRLWDESAILTRLAEAA